MGIFDDSSIPNINSDDSAVFFLKWLVEKKEFKADEICDVIEAPHKYRKQYKEFKEWNV